MIPRSQIQVLLNSSHTCCNLRGGAEWEKENKGNRLWKEFKDTFFSGGPKIEEKQSDTTKIKVSKLGWEIKWVW